MIENTVLTDKHRYELASTIDQMRTYWPEMFSRKIPESMVQFAFAYKAVIELDALIPNIQAPDLTVLSAGSHEDIATECLKIDGFSVTGIDPVWNVDLHTFAQRRLRKYKYVVSASVLEHTANDEEFVGDACDLLFSGGYGIFTMDYKDNWSKGQRVPTTSNRFYRNFDLTQRLPKVLNKHGCEVVGPQDYSAQDRFQWEGIDYSFATLIFKKL